MHAGTFGTFDLRIDGFGIGEHFMIWDSISAEELLWIFVGRQSLVRKRFDLDNVAGLDRQRRRQIGGDITPENRIGSRVECRIRRNRRTDRPAA
jgi:hypothetical protein